MDSINRIIENGKEVEPVYKKKRGIILLRQTDDLIFVSGHGPEDQITGAVSYTHLTLPTTCTPCRSRWSPYH